MTAQRQQINLILLRYTRRRVLCLIVGGQTVRRIVVKYSFEQALRDDDD